MWYFSVFYCIVCHTWHFKEYFISNANDGSVKLCVDAGYHCGGDDDDDDDDDDDADDVFIDQYKTIKK